MFTSLKRDFTKIRTGRPGSRFRDYRRHKRQQRSGKKTAARILTFLVGVSLLLGGIAIGWLPGPGGFIAIVGLAILSREVPGIALAMDKCELLLRAMFKWFRRQPVWLQVAFAFSALLIVGVFTWYGYQLLN